jgi:hypothetical protein
MNKYNFKTLERISKTTARKLYDAGNEVLFIPCKLNPENNFYNLGMWQRNDLWGQYETFEKLCNAFEYYNCNNEAGSYTAFYIKKGVA